MRSYNSVFSPTLQLLFDKGCCILSHRSQLLACPFLPGLLDHPVDWVGDDVVHEDECPHHAEEEVDQCHVEAERLETNITNEVHFVLRDH